MPGFPKLIVFLESNDPSDSTYEEDMYPGCEFFFGKFQKEWCRDMGSQSGQGSQS